MKVRLARGRKLNSVKLPQKLNLTRIKTDVNQTLSVTMTLLLQLYFLIYLIFRVDGDQKLEQKMSEVKAEDKTVTIDCQFPSNCLSYIHWYQQKKGEALKRILYSSISDGNANKDANNNDDSFKTQIKSASNIALKILKLQTEHSGIYYCACWISGSTHKLKILKPCSKSLQASCFNREPQTTLTFHKTKMFSPIFDGDLLGNIYL